VENFSFRPHHRLLTRKDYSAVFEQVDVRISKGPYLLLCRKNSLEHPRLGLIVRKKFLKRAVDRNHLKRLVRENFRTRQHRLVNLDVIFMNRGNSDHKTDKEIKSLVSDIFESLAEKHG
jgi:ribonuclease P protein component